MIVDLSDRHAKRTDQCLVGIHVAQVQIGCNFLAQTALPAAFHPRDIQMAVHHDVFLPARSAVRSSVHTFTLRI